MATAAQIALVRSVAPEFASVATYPDSVIEVRLDGWASAVVGVTFTLTTRYDLCLAYAAAHRLTLDLRATGGTGSGSGSASVGSVTSATAGPLSLTFGGAATSRAALSPLESELSQTTYGLALWTLLTSRANAAPTVV